MINAWSLLYDEINGTLDEEYPIMSKNNDDVIVFGKEEDSELVVAMDAARGGKFQEVPDNYPNDAWYSRYSNLNNFLLI